MSRVFQVVLILGLLGARAVAQTVDVAIEPARLNFNTPKVLDKLKILKESQRLLSVEQITAALNKPSPTALKLPAPSTQVLPASQVAAVARKAMVRVGWYARNRAGAWHAFAADGYAITADGTAATCYHCMELNDPTVTEAYLFAAGSDFEVHPVTAVLAADPVLDVAIIHMDGAKFSPIALNDQVAPGDTAYLLSDPNEVQDYFTTGQINRFYWRRPGKNDRNTLEGIRNLRINLSTDWSPGSSGAAVLDNCGNAIGHVSTINTINRSATEHAFTGTASAGATTEPVRTTRETNIPATYIVLHEAVPARGVRLLAESMNTETKKP